MTESSNDKTISRRGFLKGAGTVIVGAAASKLAVDRYSGSNLPEGYPLPEVLPTEYLPGVVTITMSKGEGQLKKSLKIRPHPSTMKGELSLRDIKSLEDVPLGDDPSMVSINNPRVVTSQEVTDPLDPDGGNRWIQLRAKTDPLDGQPARLTHVYIYVGRLTEEFIKFPQGKPSYIKGLLDQDGNEVKTTVIVSPKNI
jgi:hypothetical protein